MLHICAIRNVLAGQTRKAVLSRGSQTSLHHIRAAEAPCTCSLGKARLTFGITERTTCLSACRGVSCCLSATPCFCRHPTPYSLHPTPHPIVHEFSSDISSIIPPSPSFIRMVRAVFVSNSHSHHRGAFERVILWPADHGRCVQCSLNPLPTLDSPFSLFEMQHHIFTCTCMYLQTPLVPMNHNTTFPSRDLRRAA